MKNQALILAVFGIAPITPLMAQDESAGDAARSVAEAMVDDAEAVAAVLRLGREEGSPQPVSNRDTRPRDTDYPAQLWQEGPSARVEYRLQVDAQGMPTACEITQSSDYAQLDELSCSIPMERARFYPARDEDGNAIAGEYHRSHYWRKREPQFPGTSTIHVAWTVLADGTAQDCEVIEISGAISEQMQRTFEREPCPDIGRGFQAPYRDEQGNPVERRITLKMEILAEEPAGE